jgi:hypothetical protein
VSRPRQAVTGARRAPGGERPPRAAGGPPWIGRCCKAPPRRQRTLRFALVFAAALVPATVPFGLHAQRGDLTVDVAQVGAPGAIATGANAAFVVRVANGVRAPVSEEVLVRVTLPPDFAPPSASPATGSGFSCGVQGAVVSCARAGFGSREEREFRVSTTAPRGVRGGGQTFQVQAVVDPDNDVPERNNGNNSDNLAVTVEPRAELSVSLVSAADLTTQVAPNLVYVVTVRNGGDGEATNLLTRATLPKDVAFTGVEENQLGACLQNSAASGGELNVNCTLPSLPAGQSRHVRIKGRITGSIPDGSKVTFAANADPDNTVRERNDTDNTAFMITTVRAPSDLRLAASVTASRSGVTHSGTVECLRQTTLNLALTVTNGGPFRSKATTVVTAWQSVIRAAPGAACFERCNVPALDPGASSTVTAKGEVTENVGGDHAVTSIVDPDQALFDPVLANNRVTPIVCGTTP